MDPNAIIIHGSDTSIQKSSCGLDMPENDWWLIMILQPFWLASPLQQHVSPNLHITYRVQIILQQQNYTIYVF